MGDNSHIKPIFEGKEVKKWHTQKATQNLILFESKWTNDSYKEELNEEEKLASLSKDFPQIISHLFPFKERAKKRYDKGEYWWELRNCAYYNLFEKPKIIFPNLQNNNKFCLDTDGTYVNAPAVFLPSDSKTLLCILNSKIVWEFLKSICVVRSGGYIEVKPQYFEQIPLPEFQNEDKFYAKATNVINLTKDLQVLDNKFKKYFSSSLSLYTISRKLENWQDLDFSDFIKELEKARKKASKEATAHAATRGLNPLTITYEPLTKKDEFEWLELFEENKKKAQELQSQIDKTEKEIDRMVYELYGLTEEEIEIVENS